MVSESDIKMQEPEENENDGLPSVDAARDFYMKYDVRNRLGKGLSSVVHVCVEKFSGLSFAVKIMDITEHHINADGMNIVQQIHEEIRLLKRVEGHQYVIRLVEVFESETFIFIVFELCQNDDLFEYLSSNVNLSEKRCRAIMKQIFEAVYHCHQVCYFFMEFLQHRFLHGIFSFSEKCSSSRHQTRKCVAGQRAYRQVDRFWSCQGDYR
jgi:serine/threonine protein kinase